MCAMVNEPVTLTDKALEANKWKTNLARFKPAFANTYKVVMTTCHCGRRKKKTTTQKNTHNTRDIQLLNPTI